MKSEEKYNYDYVDIDDTECPVCKKKTLAAIGLLDPADFGNDCLFEMWLPVQCTSCGAKGAIGYEMDEKASTLNMPYEDGFPAGIECPECTRNTWDFDYSVDHEIKSAEDPLVVLAACNDCGRVSQVVMKPFTFVADYDWLEVDDEE